MGSSSCGHIITVYPSSGTTSGTGGTSDQAAVIWLVVVIVMIMMCALIFFMYDYNARRHHRQTQERAAKTNAIISSLYPADIRDRLLGRKTKKDKTSPLNDDHHAAAASSNNNKGVESSKFRLKSYLKEEDDAVAAAAAGSDANNKVVDIENMDENQREIMKGTDMYDTKPIAELFPATTVMFADIAGFTAWSSVREPSQVFTLLETVYAAFDAIAKRRRVFKVEVRKE
jgi:Adenylate and Guanylate cyclase catalytic domain